MSRRSALCLDSNKHIRFARDTRSREHVAGAIGLASSAGILAVVMQISLMAGIA